MSVEQQLVPRNYLQDLAEYLQSECGGGPIELYRLSA